MCDTCHTHTPICVPPHTHAGSYRHYCSKSFFQPILTASLSASNTGPKTNYSKKDSAESLTNNCSSGPSRHADSKIPFSLFLKFGCHYGRGGSKGLRSMEPFWRGRGWGVWISFSATHLPRSRGICVARGPVLRSVVIGTAIHFSLPSCLFPAPWPLRGWTDWGRASAILMPLGVCRISCLCHSPSCHSRRIWGPSRCLVSFYSAKVVVVYRQQSLVPKG